MENNNDFNWDQEPETEQVPAEPEVPVESEAPAEPEAPVAAPKRRKPATRPAAKPVNLPFDVSKLPLKAIGIAAVALIVVIILISSLGGPKNLAKKYVKANVYGDIVAMHKYLAYDNYANILGDEDEEDYFEDLSDDLDEEITSWKDLAKYNREESEENLEDEYGDYKIEMEITKVKDVSARSLEKDFEYLYDRLEDNTDFDRDDISAGKTVKIKMKIKGDEGTERYELTVYLVKMGMSWKVLTQQYD